MSAIVPTGTPRSLAASRSTTTWTSGLRSESVVSRSTSPGFSFSSAISCVGVLGELVQVGPGEVDLEGLRPAAPLERPRRR